MNTVDQALAALEQFNKQAFQPGPPPEQGAPPQGPPQQGPPPEQMPPQGPPPEQMPPEQGAPPQGGGGMPPELEQMMSELFNGMQQMAGALDSLGQQVQTIQGQQDEMAQSLGAPAPMQGAPQGPPQGAPQGPPPA